MLDETYRCDGPDCTRFTSKKHPGANWKFVQWLLAHVQQSPTDDIREWHYCSDKCQFNAVALKVVKDAKDAGLFSVPSGSDGVPRREEAGEAEGTQEPSEEVNS